MTEQSFKIVVNGDSCFGFTRRARLNHLQVRVRQKRKHEYKTDFTHSCIVPKGCLSPPQISISNQRLFEIKTLIYVVIIKSFGENMAVCGMSFHIFLNRHWQHQRSLSATLQSGFSSNKWITKYLQTTFFFSYMLIYLIVTSHRSIYVTSKL